MLTAPTYDLTMAIWEPTVDAINEHLKALRPAYNKSERYIELKFTGARLYRRSGDNPDSLRSRGLNFAVVDEAGMFSDDAYNALRPALSDRRGWLYAVGTPKGRNWFYTGYQRGLDGDPDYLSLNHPSTVNPWFDPAEMDAARSDMPERIWRQEFLGEFLADAASVFGLEAIKRATGGQLEAPIDGARYVAGVDLAKYTDWSVIVVLRTDVTPWRVVAIDRFNRLPWDAQERRLLDLLGRYGCRLALIDKTGIGDAVVESLARQNRKIEGWTFTASSKETIVSGLAVALEQRKVQIPAACDVLLRELGHYEYELRANGHVAYSAPPGLHDDAVMSLGLAVQAAHQHRGFVPQGV